MSQLKYIPSIIEQYVDEVPFLYSFRKNASIAPDYVLDELAELDERLEANICGLLMMGDVAWDMCEEALALDREGDVFTLTLLAIELNDLKRLQWIIVQLDSDEKTLFDSVVDAFGYFPFQKIAQLLKDMYTLPMPIMQTLVIASLLFHRQVPEKLIQHNLISKNFLTKKEVIFSVGIMGMQKYLNMVTPLLDDENEDIAFAACWTETRFGNQTALAKLERFITHPQYGDLSLQYVVMQNDIHKVTGILRKMFADKSTKRLSIMGLGYVGKANSIPSLITMMDAPETARVSGEAFSLLTGINLTANNLSREDPVKLDAEPLDSADDDNVEMDPDQDLPWPDAEKIKQWWSQNQQNYYADKRYIGGRELSIGSLKQMLKQANQRQRLFASNILALYDRNHPLFNTQAPAKRQKVLLGNL